jgi:hypothetical protein
MSDMPKLKIKKQAWDKDGEIQEFERAKDFPYDQELIIVAEGRQITSYDDLLKMITQDLYKNKEFLEVMFLPVIVGG